MEIVIGATSYVGTNNVRSDGRGGENIEAQVLNVRQPRKNLVNPPEGENHRKNGMIKLDPANGRVMTILVPNGYRLPEDISTGKYRVFLRFAPK
ncbi:MAG: hypothetical protein K9L30_00400 [Desulfobacterales bacterium]|nr:hypothetical protein [Desulfobacterales bacterium]